MAAAWPIKFDITVDGRRHGRYYRVFVFKTKAAMYDYERALAAASRRRVNGRLVGIGPLRPGHFNFDAITHRHDGYHRYRGRWRRSRQIGQILFYDGASGSGVVAHEMTHAALYSFDGWRRRSPDRLDEALAWRIGAMVSCYWREYYKQRPA